MAIVLERPSNGVSFGVNYTVTSTDNSDGYVLFNFQVKYNIVASIQVLTSANINYPLVDAVITYPAVGQVRIANGAATFTLAAGQKIIVVANRLK